eukprot:gene23509-30478_t
MFRMLSPLLLFMAGHCIFTAGTLQEGTEKGNLRSLTNLRKSLFELTREERTSATPIRHHIVRKERKVVTQAVTVTPICLYGECTPSKGNAPCIAGTTCIFKDQFYSQCLLDSSQDATSQCALNYQVCATGLPCCSEAFTCLNSKCEEVAPPECAQQNYYSLAPTTTPTALPSSGVPTTAPSVGPTVWPTVSPTSAPTFRPSTTIPTVRPTVWPTATPTRAPTFRPSSRIPTTIPTVRPTVRPTANPTRAPTSRPSSRIPTTIPTARPTVWPTATPTAVPTSRPSSTAPTTAPTARPTANPTSMLPTCSPTTRSPSLVPTVAPTASPTVVPSTSTPTAAPSSISPIASQVICLFGDCTPSKGNAQCIAGTVCFFKDQYYSQCVLDPAQDSTSQCVQNYEACATGSSCCSKAFVCVSNKCEAIAPPQCVTP